MTKWISIPIYRLNPMQAVLTDRLAMTIQGAKSAPSNSKPLAKPPARPIPPKLPDHVYTARATGDVSIPQQLLLHDDTLAHSSSIQWVYLCKPLQQRKKAASGHDISPKNWTNYQGTSQHATPIKVTRLCFPWTQHLAAKPSSITMAQHFPTIVNYTMEWPVWFIANMITHAQLPKFGPTIHSQWDSSPLCKVIGKAENWNTAFCEPTLDTSWRWMYTWYKTLDHLYLTMDDQHFHITSISKAIWNALSNHTWPIPLPYVIDHLWQMAPLATGQGIRANAKLGHLVAASAKKRSHHTRSQAHQHELLHHYPSHLLNLVWNPQVFCLTGHNNLQCHSGHFIPTPTLDSPWP